MTIYGMYIACGEHTKEVGDGDKQGSVEKKKKENCTQIKNIYSI